MPDFIEWPGMPPMVKKLKYREWLYDTFLRPYLKREAADGELLDDEWWAQWFFNDFRLHRKVKNKTALSNEEEEE
jgi:hypothetical protein